MRGSTAHPRQLQNNMSIDPEKQPRNLTQDEQKIISSALLRGTAFEYVIAEFYDDLAKNQEPLGKDFEIVWEENADNLYET